MLWNISGLVGWFNVEFTEVVPYTYLGTTIPCFIPRCLLLTLHALEHIWVPRLYA